MPQNYLELARRAAAKATLQELVQPLHDPREVLVDAEPREVKQALLLLVCDGHHGSFGVCEDFTFLFSQPGSPGVLLCRDGLEHA